MDTFLFYKGGSRNDFRINVHLYFANVVASDYKF